MEQWISGWGYQPLSFERFPIQAERETLCVQFLNNINGNEIKVRFSNRYGKEKMIFNHAEIFVLDKPEQWAGAVGKQVTINGKKTITIPATQEIFSDVLELEVRAGQYLCVSVQVEKKQKLLTGGSCFAQPYTGVYVWDGCKRLQECRPGESRQARTDLLRIEPEHLSFYGIAGVDIKTKEDVKTIVCFGDSITHRSLWTGPLMMRLHKQYPGKVILRNSGISGNRIMYDESPNTDFGPWLGKAAVKRLEQDVFYGNPVDLVTVLLGTNDIFHPLAGFAPKEETAETETMETGLAKLAELIHSHGAKAVGCTITPWKNCQGRFAQEPELVRMRVNEWIRSSSCFDYVFDFDRMIADPKDPQRMLPLYDSGDHVHPGAAGGAKMAEGIDLSALGILLGLEAGQK